MGQRPRILVVGGIVMDLIYEVPEWPVLRKAVQASAFVMQPGGKGLNQAIAAARLGAQVSVVSAIGQDHLGDLLLAELEREEVDYQFVERRSAADTDTCCVIVENSEPGFIGAKIATQTVDPKLVSKAESYIKAADVILATGEVPVDAVEAAFKLARKYKVVTIFNPAPPEKLKTSVLSLSDYLVPNEWEASVVAGIKQAGYTPVETIARSLRRRKANNVIITTGDLGSRALVGDDFKSFNAFGVEIVDTTGASDAYCATLAVALGQEKGTEDAITMASAAGALACMKFGAATSMPNKTALNDFLEREGLSIGLD